MGAKWTKEEDDFIRENADKLSAKEMAGRINRGCASIYQRLTKLGIKKGTAVASRISSSTHLKLLPEIAAYIREHYANESNSEIGEALGFKKQTIDKYGMKLGLSKSKEYLSAMGKRVSELDASKANRFQKGHEYTPVRGAGMHPNCRRNQFQKGIRPHNFEPIGTRKKHTTGYWFEKVAEGKPVVSQRSVKPGTTWRAVHYLVWERERGPVPEGYMLTFIDGNPDNYDISNLKRIRKIDQVVVNKIKDAGLGEEYMDLAIARADLKRAIQEKRRGEKKH